MAPGGTVVKREASDLDWVQESRAGIGAKLSLDFAGGKHRFVEKNRERRKVCWAGCPRAVLGEVVRAGAHGRK